MTHRTRDTDDQLLDTEQALLRSVDQAADDPHELPAPAFEPWTRQQLDRWHRNHAALANAQCRLTLCPIHRKG